MYGKILKFALLIQVLGKFLKLMRKTYLFYNILFIDLCDKNVTRSTDLFYRSSGLHLRNKLFRISRSSEIMYATGFCNVLIAK